MFTDAPQSIPFYSTVPTNSLFLSHFLFPLMSTFFHSCHPHFFLSSPLFVFSPLSPQFPPLITPTAPLLTPYSTQSPYCYTFTTTSPITPPLSSIIIILLLRLCPLFYHPGYLPPFYHPGYPPPQLPPPGYLPHPTILIIPPILPPRLSPPFCHPGYPPTLPSWLFPPGYPSALPSRLSSGYLSLILPSWLSPILLPAISPLSTPGYLPHPPSWLYPLHSTFPVISPPFYLPGYPPPFHHSPTPHSATWLPKPPTTTVTYPHFTIGIIPKPLPSPIALHNLFPHKS